MRHEVESLKNELTDKVTALKQRLLKVINDLPDSPSEVKVISPGCGIISSRNLFKNDNWSPEYWLTNSLKKRLTQIIEASGIEALSKHIEDIIQTGKVKAKNHNTITVHPEIIQKLKEAWES